MCRIYQELLQRASSRYIASSQIKSIRRHYHFNPNQSHLSEKGSRSFGDKALTLELILAEMNDRGKKGIKDSIINFRNELSNLQREYRQAFPSNTEEYAGSRSYMNAAATAMQGQQQESPAEAKKRELYGKLDLLEKRIRTVLFPPTAN